MENKFDEIRKNLEHLEDEHKLYRQRISKLESNLSEVIRIIEKMDDPKKKKNAVEILQEGLPRYKEVMKDSEYNVNMALLGTGFKGTLFDK